MNAAPAMLRFDEQSIDEIFSSIGSAEPGVVAAIAIGGVPVYRKGFGLANAELPAPLTPSMRMRIGSTTKHFTCLAYMLLCERGKAYVDDPIEKYIPNINKTARGVTMHQLMGHTSGLRDALSLSMSMQGTAPATTDQDILSWYETIDDVEFAAGTDWQYNNGCYILLTAAIELVADTTLDEFLRTEVFGPVGMNQTEMKRWERNFTTNCASLHMTDPNGEFTRDYFGFEITGEGGLISTMDDMLLWLRHMEHPTVGATDTWRLMLAPHRLSNGHSTGYGLGLITTSYRGTEVIYHGGGVLGGNSQMIKVPSAGLDISLATNRQDFSASAYANRIIDALIAEKKSAENSPEAAKINAIYMSSLTGRVVQLLSEGTDQLLSIDGAPGRSVEMKSDGRLSLKAEPSNKNIEFLIEENGGYLSHFGNNDPMIKLDSNVSSTIYDKFGKYRSDNISASAHIYLDDQEPRLTFSAANGSYNYRLIFLAHDIWQAMPIGSWPALSGVVSFVNGGTDFCFAADCIRPVRFTRSEMTAK